ncbi:MAG: DUF4837 family protein [Bacteroidaceae bacterium]|nr:DUF4837 family protein [Bacteroidaceae bacterium]
MRNLCIFLFFALLASACEEEKKGLAESKGLPAELVVVVSPQMSKNENEDTLNSVVDADAPGLASSERIFRSMTIGEKVYEKGFKMMHSQLFVKIDPSVKEPSLGIAHDVYATPQLQIMVKAPTEKQMRQYLSQNRERIQNLILDFQLDRFAGILRRQYSKKTLDDLRPLGYEVFMPVDLVATKSGKNFLWASSNRGGDRDVNFVFYTYPWNGENVADTSLFVARRDSVMKANIPGSQPDQWMTTARGEQGIPVVWASLRKIGGEARYEVRGLWEMHHAFMGGPFVSLVTVDTVERRVVVGEGFVFSPNSSKRDLLRSVEAGLRTIQKSTKPVDRTHYPDLPK